MKPHKRSRQMLNPSNWATWMAASILATACVGAGIPSESTAEEGKKFWHERDSRSNPVLEREYRPLPSLAGLIKKLKPAVVNISTTKVIKPRAQKRRRMPKRRDPFFEDFLGRRDPFDFFERFFGAPQREFRRNSLGSGFFISPDGYLLTNHHVVANASEIKAILADKREFEAKVIGTDPRTDIALLKVDPKKGRNLPFVYLGDSDKLEVGDWIIAIGNPFGLGHTVTAGIISGKDRVIGQGPYDDFLQTDASINPGNSGGPLFDSAGNVVGVNTAIIAGASGVGFAVPINLAKELIPQLRTKGKVTRGWLGVAIQDLTDELAENFNVSGKSGVLVSQVFEDGPADKAGLKPGDIILAVNGQKMTEMRQLTAKIATLVPGSKARIEFLREGKKRKLTVVLGERERGEALAQDIEGTEQGQETDLGLTLARLTAERARRLGLDKKVRGLLVEDVDPSGPASGRIQPGDVILEINRRRVLTLQDFRKALGSEKRRRRALFRIQRGTSQLFVTIQP